MILGLLKERRTLLSPDEYYRPTRARELRRKAERLDLLAVRLPHPIVLALGFFALQVLFWSAIYMTCGLPSHFWIGGVLIGPLVQLRDTLARYAAHYRAEADELEREHRAWYLPEGDDALT